MYIQCNISQNIYMCIKTKYNKHVTEYNGVFFLGTPV